MDRPWKRKAALAHSPWQKYPSCDAGQRCCPLTVRHTGVKRPGWPSCHRGNWSGQSCNRPMRPPRRLARRGARVGRSAMMAWRASCVRRDQEEISSIVRKQPTQMRSAGWIVQSLTQGDCTSSRCQTSSFTSAPRFPYAPCDPGRLAGYSLRRRHRSPLSDAFATYPPRAVPFLPQRWRGAHPRR